MNEWKRKKEKIEKKKRTLSLFSFSLSLTSCAGAAIELTGGTILQIPSRRRDGIGFCQKRRRRRKTVRKERERKRRRRRFFLKKPDFFSSFLPLPLLLFSSLPPLTLQARLGLDALDVPHRIRELLRRRVVGVGVGDGLEPRGGARGLGCCGDFLIFFIFLEKKKRQSEKG